MVTGEDYRHGRSRFDQAPTSMNTPPSNPISSWFWFAVGAAVLYGLHQVFTKLAADRISDGLGGFVVEGSAALTILVYLAYLRFSGGWNQTASVPGVYYSLLTGLCVGVGTIFFFV